MDNNGKINRGIDLGTTNSAIAVMENGVPVIKKSSTQKDTTPSIVSVNRKGVIHIGDTAANELANQMLRATKTWDGRSSSTDVFKEFKRTMGTVEVYHSKNLKKDFNSQQLSAEIIKALSANAGINDGGCIVISVPAKFDGTQKTATVEAARLAGFRYVELIQEPIAAAIAFGVTTGQTDGFWLVFDLGGGTFDAALLRVDGGVQQVVDTEGDSYLGGKDIDYALVDSILIPFVKKNYKVDMILASEKKAAMLREALKVYAEAAKVALPTVGVAHGRKTTMKLVLDNENTVLKIPVYQAGSYTVNSPASLYEYVGDVLITGKDVKHEVPAGTEVEIQVAADSSEMMTFTVSVPNVDEDVVKQLDTSPRFNAFDADKLIAEYIDNARRSLRALESENVAVDVLRNRLFALKHNCHHTEKKAIVEQYKELLRDIYRLECDTAWERVIRKVNKEMALLQLNDLDNGDERSHCAFRYLEAYVESAKANRDVAAAKNILEEISFLNYDLKWKTRIPETIKWYDRNFDNMEWDDKEHARRCVNQALELIKKMFTKEQVKDALRNILSARKSTEEIREAEGLLG